jgi:hypothetical protein
MAEISLYAYLEIDNVTFNASDVQSINFNSEDEQVDAGGFNTDGDTTFLSGQRTKSVDVTFYMNRAAGKVHQVLYPLHRDRSIFDFEHRANMNNAVSATNQQLRGSARLPAWAETKQFGQVETLTLTFVSDISDPLEYYAT